MSPRSRWMVLTPVRGGLAGALALALLSLPITARAQEPNPGSVEGADCAVVGTLIDCAPTATPIEPDPAVVDARPTPWEHIVVSADGRTLEVFFWMGVTECHGLHSVAVERDGGVLSVTLMTGSAPDATDRFCIAVAQLYVTTVELDEPLIGNVP